jgi:Tol biopolymer transport system component
VTEAGLFRIDIQTEEVTPIASSPAGFTLGLPQFSPDGKKVYYLKLADSAARANDGAIIERDLAAGSEREVFRGNSRGAMLSPDGRYFAKGGDAGSAANTKSMVLIPVSGGGPREVFRVATGGDLGKGWTPDSQGLIVWRTNGEAGSQPEAWLYGINGGEPRKLDIDASGVNVNGPNPIRVHPDGRQIAYVASKRANGVWVLENFLPTAKAAPAAK